MPLQGACLRRRGWRVHANVRVRASRDCQEFRAGLGMMGAKEPAHAATQRTPYS